MVVTINTVLIIEDVSNVIREHNKVLSNRRNKKYRRKHRKELRLRSEKYRDLYPERIKKACDKWRKNHPEDARNNLERWRKHNPVKRSLQAHRYYMKKKHKMYTWEVRKGVVVAVTCIYCEELILTNRPQRKFCVGCKHKRYRAVPRYVRDAIEHHPSFTPMSEDLRIWKRIIYLRSKHIDKVRIWFHKK